MEIGYQYSILDFLNQSEQKEELQIGKFVENIDSYKGKKIPFRNLKDFIGKKVLIAISDKHLKVAKITSFREDTERVYMSPDGIRGEYYHDTICNEEKKKSLEFIGYTDRIGYSDNIRGKENAWVSEIFCTNGRYTPCSPYNTECMYEII